ncbi:dipeptide epimerase [Candidatus Poribacteria bacterium]|nr:dipeptide epimerase [Candidatus Poribacteria bacterium]MYG07009.1 dipeptide epimerase [Candidatus Poribacteria bacterium]MYK24032.1 dipeptide epimerase [Candidatus Poribacteria bacterium]
MNIASRITNLQLKHPFKIARRATDAYRQVISVEIDGGIGETAPARFYGETVETVSVTVEAIASAFPDNLDAIHEVMATVETLIGGNYAAKSAIDMALHDRLGKKLCVPLYQLWGFDPQKTPCTAFTIGLDEPEVMAEKVRNAEAYPILKVKLGTPRDIEIIETLRGVTNKPIYVDANTAWTPKEAVRKIRELARYGIELIEQPTKPDDLAGLKFVRDNSELPIIADESVKRASDIPALAECVDGINIKLVKCGGLLEAYRMIHVARAHGLLIMIGCMIESSLGITAAAHLTPLVDYADLDGNLLITNDPYTGVILDNGKLILPKHPGIGVM